MDFFSNPDLDKFLIKNKISYIYISGIDASHCVDKTIKAVLNCDYKVNILTDCIAAFSETKLKKKISEFKELGVNILISKELVTK